MPPLEAAPPGRGGPVRRSIDWLVGLAIAIVVSVATLILIEGAASLLLFGTDYLTATPSELRRHTQEDTLLGWAGRRGYDNPNAFGAGQRLSTDPEGRRAAPPVPGSPGGPTIALVCSGDSYTLGLGVGDAHPWCAQLQQHFGGLRTINMGQADYGLDQAFLWYRRDAADLAPRVHVFAVTAPELERSASPTFLGRNKPYLTLERDRLTVANVPVPAQSARTLRRASAARALDDLRAVQVIRDRPSFDRGRRTAALVDERWPAFEKAFDELADRTTTTAFVLLYLPTQRDRQPGRLDGWRDRLSAYASRRGVAFVDLTRDLRALRPDSADLAFITPPPGGSVPFTGQYSDLGHAWVARTLAARLSAIPALASVLPAASARRPRD